LDFFYFFYWLRPGPTTLVWVGTVWPKKLKQTVEWPREDEEEEEEEEEADLQLSGAAGGDGRCCGCGPWCWLADGSSFFLCVSLMLFISSAMFFLLFPVLFFLYLSSPLKRPLVQNSIVILCFFLVPSVSQTFSPLFSLLLPPFVCLYFLLSFSFMFPLKLIIFPWNPLFFVFSCSSPLYLEQFFAFSYISSPLFVCPSPVFIGGQGREPPLPSPIAPNG
jgi:hypothetical protein